MRVLIHLVVLPLLVACAGDETVARYGGTGHVWRLAELNGTAYPAPATLSFPETGQIAGTGPCNSFAARMVAPYPWFDAGNLVITERACPETSAEQAYFTALARVTQSEVLDNTLILSGGGTELVFTSDG